VTCTVCARPINGASIADRDVNVHPECVPAGLFQDARDHGRDDRRRHRADRHRLGELRRPETPLRGST
jgi:hypothetical protein